jgi:LmbE family N-acetylglucosaminyl deacetylase
LKKWRKWILPAVLVLIILSTGWLYLVTRWGVVPSLDSLIPIPLPGHQRLLVLAPHCDDETLGAGGLILAAQRAGMEVRVVIATNGDGFLFATMQDFHRLYPRAQDFIRMGNLRQQESLAALHVLGIAPEQVTFLGYPDRGTPSLWNENWSAADPYRSPYINATHSPYPITYNPDSVYAGEDYLADLRSILDSYRPDLIIYPHPDDVHPDHWGLSVFTRLALAMQERDDSTYRPEVYAYLVHRPDFPVQKELHPTCILVPPPLLYSIYPDWFRLDLPSGDTALKGNAVEQYKSQLPLLRDLMVSFVRANELFARPEPAALATIASGEPLNPATWQDASGQIIGPVQKDPVRDLISRQVVAAADLVALYAAQTADGSLAICAQARGDAESGLIYTLRVKAVGEEITSHAARSRNLQSGQTQAALAGSYVCDTVKLSDLRNPWLLALGVDVEGTGAGILDQIAWQLVYVNGRP